MSILEIENLNKNDKYEAPILDKYESLFVSAIASDDKINYVQAIIIFQDIDTNKGSIGSQVSEALGNESATIENIEVMYHTNVTLKTTFDYLNDWVVVSQAAEKFLGLGISMFYGSPLNGYTTNSTDSIRQNSLDGKTPVIGKMRDLNNTNISSNEYKIADYLPNQGNPRLNWTANSSALRSAMSFNQPIRDVSHITYDNYGFLQAERELLRFHGWIYSDGYWYPPN